MNRRRIQAADVLLLMQRGAVLVNLGPGVWRLSPTGQKVDPAAAMAVIGQRNVVGSNDGLISGISQTYRAVKETSCLD
jgi:hypothetical protein